MADPALTDGPCGLQYDLRCVNPETLAGYDQWMIDRSMQLARDAINALTAGKAANCPTSIRPCHDVSRGCGWWEPVIVDGVWYNQWCGTLKCTPTHEIMLPGGVAEIIEVTVDGQTVPPSAYRVDDNGFLVRIDGQPWPMHQNMDVAAGESDTFVVTYRPGIDGGAGQAYALGVLAAEFMKSCDGGRCRLPKGVTQIVRQGVTMDISSGAWPDGLTGIPEVDQFLQVVNPNGLAVAPSVWSPDLSSPRVTTVSHG